MNNLMTRNTNRNYIKPTLFGIAFVVMVMLCLRRTAMAFKSIGSWQFTRINSVINGIYSFNSFRVSKFPAPISNFILFASIIAIRGSLTFLCFAISFLSFALGLFCFISLRVSPMADYAVTSISTWPAVVSMKLRNGFNLFAFSTGLCYDLLRHRFFLIKKLCLEPVSGHNPASGLFYYSISQGGVK